MRFYDAWIGRIAQGLWRRAFPGVVFSQWQTASGETQPDPEGVFQKAFEQVAAVFTCVSIFASFAAMVPYRIYRIPKGKSEEEKEPVEWEHPAASLFRSINDWTTAYQYAEAEIAYLLLSGNTYILKQGGTLRGQDYIGPAEELWILRPDRVKIVPNADGSINHWEYSAAPGEPIKFPPNQVCQIKRFNPYNSLYGQSVVRALQGAITTDVRAENYNANFLKNQARPAGAVVIKGSPPGIPQQERDRKEIQRVYRNPGTVGIFYGDTEWKDWGLSQKDMEFLEGRKFSREQIINAIIRYPTVAGLPSANYATADNDRRMFAENVVMPEMARVEQARQEFILSDFGPDVIGRFDWSQVSALREDMTAKATMLNLLVNGRRQIITQNEARTKYLHLEADETNPENNLLHIDQPLAGGFGMMGKTDPKRSRTDDWVPNAKHEARWLAYVRRIESTEKQARGWLSEMFDTQQAKCVENLQRARSLRGIDDIWDPTEQADLAEPVVKRILIAGAEQGIEHGIDALGGLDVTYGLDNPRLVEWIATQTMRQVKFINDTTADALRTTISEALDKGETLKEIRDRLDVLFEGRRGNVGTIARTEVQQSVQHTQTEVWKDTGVVEQNGWIASQSPNMRDSHGAQDAVEVAIGEPFPNGCRYPGDPNGLPEESINCMCDLYPVVNAMAKMEYLNKRLADLVYPAKGKGSRLWQTKENEKALKR